MSDLMDTTLADTWCKRRRE